MLRIHIEPRLRNSSLVYLMTRYNHPIKTPTQQSMRHLKIILAGDIKKTFSTCEGT
jgi:hypothetical protein